MHGLLLCIGGLSTSLIAAAMTKLGASENNDFQAGSILTGDWLDQMNEYDIFIISPQTAFRYQEVVKEVAQYGRNQRVYQIPPHLYVPTKAAELYAAIKEFASASA